MTDDSPPLVLLPGMDGSGRLFAPFVAALPTSRRAIILRYPQTLASYDELTDYAVRFLPEGPCVLLGESFSGPVAARLAQRFPERVRALVLAASFVAAPLPRFFASMAPSFYGSAASAWLVKYLMASKRTPPEILATIMEILAEAPQEMWRGRLRAALTEDARPQLAATRCPLLVLQAGSDRLLRAPTTMQILRTRPCVAMRLTGAPHLLMQSAPAECASAIAGFLHRSLV